MIDTRTDRNRALTYLAEHPWRTIVWLLPLGILVMILVDAAMGASAEYFNATHLLQAWGEVLTGGSIDDAPSFVMRQDDLAAPVALVIGTVLLVLEPAIIIGLVVLPASWLARRSLR